MATLTPESSRRACSSQAPPAGRDSHWLNGIFVSFIYDDHPIMSRTLQHNGWRGPIQMLSSARCLKGDRYDQVSVRHGGWAQDFLSRGRFEHQSNDSSAARLSDFV